jgi:uncharacterized protein (DUF849 family)
VDCYNAGFTILHVHVRDPKTGSYKTVANTCSQIKVKLHVERTADLVRITIQNGITNRVR